MDWLSSFYNGDIQQHKAIIQATTGNGKTYICQLLAKEYGAELYRLTSFNIKSENDFVNFLKAVNSTPLYHKRKLILIDDFQEFPSRYKKQLAMLESVWPIIYTTESLGLVKDYYDNVVKNNLVVRLDRPMSYELREHLQQKMIDLHLTVETNIIENIIQECKSVRSAELSLYNCAINDLCMPFQTTSQKLKAIKMRKVDFNIDRENINTIHKAIRGYDENALKVMERFADFEFRIRGQFQEIEPFLVNQMLEPIETVEFGLTYKPREQYTNNKKSKEKPVEKVVKKKGPTLEGFI